MSIGDRRVRVLAGITAAAGTALFALWVAFGIGGARVTLVVDDVGEMVPPLLAAAACWWLIRRGVARSVRRSWRLLGISALAWALGEGVWAYYEVGLGRTVPFPSLADVGFLAAVPLAVAALFLYPTAPVRSATRTRVVLDGLLVCAAVLFVSWATVLGPLYGAHSGSAFEQVLSLAYPAGDVLMGAVVLVVAARAGRGHRGPLAFIGTGLVAMALADSTFAYLTQKGTFGLGNVLDTGWVAGYFLIALGAVWQRGSTPLPEQGDRPTKAAVIVPYVPIAGVLAVVVGFRLAGHRFGPFLEWNGLALLVIFGVRQLLVLLDNVALNHRLEARVEQRTAELREREALFSALVQKSSDVVTIIGEEGQVFYQSPSSARVLGYQPHEIEGRSIGDLVHPDDVGALSALLMQATIQPAADLVTEWRIRHNDGTWRHIESRTTNLLADAAVAGLVLNSRDVSDRKALEDQLRHQAFHDSLTGLANRALFQDRLAHALDRGRRADQPLAVLFLDLDDFKAVNDGRGHPVGDELLTAVGQRLRADVRTADTVARLGGDEFAILLEPPGSAPEDVAQRILASLHRPFVVDGSEIAVQASIGIACADTGTETVADLVRNADVAMYMAKGNGKGRYEVFRAEMHDAVIERLELAADLRRAIEREEFVVHYQPIVAVATGETVGVEALVRWIHPDRGLVPPAGFIGIAEANGLIVELGAWVLARACAEVGDLQRAAGRPDLRLSVNLSPRQLDDPGLAECVARVLDETGFEPALLTLEITESVLLERPSAVMAGLNELKRLGVSLSIDDFGTGYSSLSYLHELPVDELKIDRSFVSRLDDGPEDVRLVNTILTLAREFHLETVAEGIEATEQLEQLRSLGCHLAQGFYFSTPIPGSELVGRLRSRPALSAVSSSTA